MPAAGDALVALGCCVAFALQLTSIVLVLWRSAGRSDRRATAEMPGVTLLRPVRGLENHIEETLASSFVLSCPEYEVLFCVADPDDPVVPLVRRLIAEHPGVQARLLVGDDAVSANPKLNNLVKGWSAAQHAWIAMVDSNVMLPPDCLQVLLGRWSQGTGLVSSPPAGIRPVGFWAELESGFLDTYQARWQLAADQLGWGFAQGKILFWRREVLEAGGGIVALGAEMAEDVAATKLVRRSGLKVRLVRLPFPQPLGARTLAEVWARQLRWARVRRMGFGGYFAVEILTGPMLPLLGAIYLTVQGVLPPPLLIGLCVVWYAAEITLALAAGWPASLRTVFAWLLRDLMLPVIWIAALTGRSLEWRGNRMAAGTTPVPTRSGT